ncbi:MAG TPA: ABC transporter permease [Chloroflexota bacterium]|nr:ABC transporter permease [Chloroflexota bacterium]
MNRPLSRRLAPAPQASSLWVRAGMARLASLVVGAAVLLAVWLVLARALPPEILPPPGAVWLSFLQSLRDGLFVPAFLTTFEEAGLGWVIAVICAVPLGYLLGRFRVLEDALAPYLAGSQAMPIVAVAPLLLIWLGFGWQPKVTICALIAFFPILATTADGVRGVPRDLVDAARVFGAGGLALAVWIYLPLAARPIFAGLKVAAALAVTGAVVGEFVSADQGLGYLVMQGRQNFEIPLMFVALLALFALGAAGYFAVSVVERAVLRWDE